MWPGPEGSGSDFQLSARTINGAGTLIEWAAGEGKVERPGVLDSTAAYGRWRLAQLVRPLAWAALPGT